ncbi:hypothetical protein BJY04DRAFT_219256 [Aspergillus karnatakaensis]|uniref:FAD-dependent oxidoreductase n=1 Tax=Aspergillus karnatakaensis TaxID=1810916 RepID=UPI003CCDB346
MPLNIAIIGAGVGGLTLAIALQDNPNLSIQVYERATELKEIGALVGVGPNALRTLEKLGVTDVLTDEVGWRSPSGIPMIFRHWKTDELLGTDQYHDVPDRRHHYARMHRAKLQQALLKRVPSGVIHLGKKVEAVTVVREKGATVTFTDGTSIEADVVVGADGIKSELTPPSPAQQASSSAPASATGFGVTASYAVNPETNPQPTWNGPASVDTVREHFKDWAPVIPKIISRIPSVRQYANVAGPELEGWTFADRVTLLGDAAHTHGSAFAAGVGLAIDDAYALGLAFDHVLPPDVVNTTGVVSVDRVGEIFEL